MSTLLSFCVCLAPVCRCSLTCTALASNGNVLGNIGFPGRIQLVAGGAGARVTEHSAELVGSAAVASACFSRFNGASSPLRFRLWRPLEMPILKFSGLSSSTSERFDSLRLPKAPNPVRLGNLSMYT